MSRFSIDELRRFVTSSAFDIFCRNVHSHFCVTQEAEVQLWPLSDFKDHHERTRYVAFALREVTRRSNLSKDDPDFVETKYKLAYATVVALLPDGIVGAKPLQVLNNAVTGLDVADLAKRLADRVPESGIIRNLNVFFPKSEKFISFSNGVLDLYEGRLTDNRPLKVDRNELCHLLRMAPLLESMNMALFISAIRDRLPEYPYAAINLGDIRYFAQLVSNHCITDVLFLGALTAPQIHKVFYSLRHPWELEKFRRYSSTTEFPVPETIQIW